MNYKLYIKVCLSLMALLLVLFIGEQAYSWWQRTYNTPQQVTVIVTPTPTPTVTVPPTATPTPVVSPTATATPTPKPTATPTAKSAATINLDVPFTVQAPTANWDEVHEELCEEASILMAAWYATGKSGSNVDGYKNLIPRATAESEMQSMVTWQNNTFGYYKDTTAAETHRILKEKLGITNASLITNVTADTIKAELNKGNVVIVPAAGQVLNNPYFKQPGPPYHMFVVRGYNTTGFITNDPGTRRGEGLVYTEANLMDALHDWTGQDSTMETGAKVIISVGKQS